MDGTTQLYLLRKPKNAYCPIIDIKSVRDNRNFWKNINHCFLRSIKRRYHIRELAYCGRGGGGGGGGYLTTSFICYHIAID